MRDGELDSSGRLFSVNSISLSKTGSGNVLNAVVAVDAYIYGATDASAAASDTGGDAPVDRHHEHRNDLRNHDHGAVGRRRAPALVGTKGASSG